jgi:glutamyl endopeptidase
MKKKTSLIFILVTILAVIASSSMTTEFVNAQEGGGVDPDTIISNTDGVLPTLSFPEMNNDFSNPRRGSGKLAEFNTIIPEEDLNVPPLDGPVLEEGAIAESVIAPDGRTRVTATTTFPNRAIAYLVVHFSGGSTGSCTGWFIGPRTVVTAGHCVYDTATNKWATSITVYPGRNGTTAPYGSTTSHKLFSVTGWTSSHSSNYDYGAIQTNAALGNTVGWFGYRWQSSNSFPGSHTVRGYPGDKPSGQLWTMNGGVTHVNTYRLWYNIDTYGGQSGSPFYSFWTGSGCKTNCYYGVGIHTYGTSVSPYFGNSATRIREAVFNNYVNWKKAAYP